MLYGRFAITMSYHKKVNAVAVTDNEKLLDKNYPFSSGYFAVTRKVSDTPGNKIADFL